LCSPFEFQKDWDARHDRQANIRNADDGAIRNTIGIQMFKVLTCLPMGTSAADLGKRRFRYVAVFWAALQATARLCSALMATSMADSNSANGRGTSGYAPACRTGAPEQKTPPARAWECVQFQSPVRSDSIPDNTQLDPA
jgi:hypothetical protein